MDRKIYPIKKIIPEQAVEIINTRKPLGLFYCVGINIYTGIDNRDGDAWTEDFKSLSTCKRWLEK